MSNETIHLVVQRYRSCRILIEETKWVHLGKDDKHCGILIYVSFAEGATKQKVQTAAETLCNLSVLTTGGWGDGAAPKSLLQLITASEESHNVSIAIVPQANLISKVKSKGKSIQYHGQIKKEEGAFLFEYFVNFFRGCIIEATLQKLPEWYIAWKNSQSMMEKKSSPDPSIPSERIFQTSEYSAWEDDTGIPLLLADGTPVAKSAKKKMTKLQQAHSKRHTKWLESERKDVQPKADATPLEEKWKEALHTPIVAGSFGKRQGLEFQSDMGPFCHTFQI